jgi:hypothetical protein
MLIPWILICERIWRAHSYRTFSTGMAIAEIKATTIVPPPLPPPPPQPPHALTAGARTHPLSSLTTLTGLAMFMGYVG